MSEAQSILDKLVEQYSEFVNIHKESIVLDARQCGDQLDILKRVLKTIAQPLRVSVLLCVRGGGGGRQKSSFQEIVLSISPCVMLMEIDHLGLSPWVLK